MSDDNAKKYVSRLDNELKPKRLTWESQWQEANDLVHPDSVSVLRMRTPGTPRTRMIYDGTAVMARGELAAALQSYVISPTDRWFNLTTHDQRLLNDRDAIIWLEAVSDIIYYYYSLPKGAFNPAVSEIFNDMAGYGTGCLYQDFNIRYQQPVFKSVPMANVWVDENSDGQIDTVYTVWEWTARQAYQMFGDDIPAKVREALEKPSGMGQRSFKFLHAVEPREGWVKNAKVSYKFPFVSCWIFLDASETISEEGYRSFPYVVPRWRRITGQTYGYGPAFDLMPFIKNINAFARLILVASEKAVDPPILVPDDGFMSPLQTIPGQLIHYDSTMINFGDMVKPLEFKGNLQFGIEHLNRLSDLIERGFYIDFIRANRKKERQSVPEINDDRDEMLRQLSSVLGRQEVEMQAQILARTYEQLTYYRLLPPPPQSLRHQKLKVEFVSAAARAQTGSKATAITQLLQDLVPLGQISQGAVYDAIDTDAAVQQIVSARDISLKIIRAPRDVAAIRKQRQDQQDMSQGAQTGAQIAGAAKDMATAQSLGGTSQPIMQ